MTGIDKLQRSGIIGPIFEGGPYLKQLILLTMSSYTRINTVTVNIDRYMSKQLGLNKSLSDQERKLFAEFNSLSENEDYMFLWSCAQMVADNMALDNPEVVLTQYGVTERSFLNGDVVVTEEEEVTIKQRILDLNRVFLVLWKKKTEEMQVQREKINSLTEETRNLLDKNIYAVEAIRRVIQMLIDDGFSPTNPEVINTSVSQAFSKGVHIHAENSLKEEREVWLFLPGGKTKVHVNTKNVIDCARTAREVAIKVAEVLKGISGASIPISTELEGTILDCSGRAPDRKKEEPDTYAQQKQELAKSNR